MRCSNCGKEITAPYKVGPKLRFCNRECYAEHSIRKYPGTPIERVLSHGYPHIAKKVKTEQEVQRGEQSTGTEG